MPPPDHSVRPAYGLPMAARTATSTRHAGHTRQPTDPPEALLLIGIQGAGKSTFCRERLFDTHVRINLDMLRTRHREARLLEACLSTRQSFVVDNTNVTREQRARYVAPARAAGFLVLGFFFPPEPAHCLERMRDRVRQVPLAGFHGTLARLESPQLDEGFDRLQAVRALPGGSFEIADLD